MVSLKLAKPWLDHAIGDTVQVDPLRAQWLRENGYEDTGLETPASQTAAPARATDEIIQDAQAAPFARKRVSSSKLREPLTDLEVHPPVADLPVLNQDPSKD